MHNNQATSLLLTLIILPFRMYYNLTGVDTNKYDNKDDDGNDGSPFVIIIISTSAR